MKKYKYQKPKTTFKINESVTGKPREILLAEMTEKKETPEGIHPAIYTDRREGVLPGFDIRTDRFEIARETAEKIKTANHKKEAAAAAKSETVPTVENGENNQKTE